MNCSPVIQDCFPLWNIHSIITIKKIGKRIKGNEGSFFDSEPKTIMNGSFKLSSKEWPDFIAGTKEMVFGRMQMRKIAGFLIIFIFSFISHAENKSINGRYRVWENGPSDDPSFFPIAVWLQDPRNADRYKEAGINLYVGLWKGPTAEQLALLKKSGMRVICSQNKEGLAHRDDSTIAGWMHNDEPDNAQPITDPQTGEKSYGPPVAPDKVIQDYKEMRKKDPSRPVFLNLGQGVANDEWVGRGKWGKKEDYYSYVKGCDILSYDVYPVAGIRKSDGENYLWYVARGVERLLGWSKGEKIVWNCIECTHIDDENAKATPHQVKAEVWMSIVHGSMGIIYFVHEFKPKFNEHALLDDPEMLKAVTGNNRLIHSLAPVLNSPTLPGVLTVEASQTGTQIAVLTKKLADKIYVFAVEMRNQSTDAVFKLSDAYSFKQVKEIQTQKKIDIQQGKWADSFSAYDVRIYEIDLGEG